MKPNSRQLKKWRKQTPATHKSFGEKRNRSGRQVEEEIRDMIREDRKYRKED